MGVLDDRNCIYRNCFDHHRRDRNADCSVQDEHSLGTRLPVDRTHLADLPDLALGRCKAPLLLAIDRPSSGFCR
nr:putative integron gene cassette protein [uncultured bacterium]